MDAPLNPSPSEVRHQLIRLGGTESLTRNKILFALLTELVEGELAGNPASEHNLGVKVFAKHDGWKPYELALVRENCSRLRKLLELYYAVEGKDDLVIIALPKGSGRTPKFSYNATRLTANRHDSVLQEIIRTFPKMLPRFSKRGIGDLEKCIASGPDYAPPYATLAEIYLLYAALDDPLDFPTDYCLKQAEWAITKCLELNAEYWLGHVVAGALHCCRFRWKDAHASFEKALEIEPTKTRSYFWYQCFLMATGRGWEVCSQFTDVMQIRPNNRVQGAIHALILYVLREPRGAHQILTDYSVSWDYVTKWETYASGGQAVISDNWLVDVLLSCLQIVLNYSTAFGYADRGAVSSQVGAFNGLIVYAGSQLGKIHPSLLEAALDLFGQMKETSEAQGDISFALGHMAFEEHSLAVARLRKACQDGNPLMMWLHLLPLFDPLRELQEFQDLVYSLDLPKEAQDFARTLRLKKEEEKKFAALQSLDEQRTADWD